MARSIGAHDKCTGPRSVEISYPTEDVRRLDSSGNLVTIKGVRFKATKERCSCGEELAYSKKVL